MFTTTNESLKELLDRFTPIPEHRVAQWRTRSRSATTFPGQTYAPGFRIQTTKLGSNADVALLLSNRDNYALVLRVYSGSDFATTVDGKPAQFPVMDPVSVFRSNEDEVRDLLLSIASAYAKESDDGFGDPDDLVPADADEDDAF